MAMRPGNTIRLGITPFLGIATCLLATAAVAQTLYH
jgi:hypothetical protein